MKKQKFRFTLQFDKNDTEHQKVVEILNNQGKKKSQYIVMAVLNYIKASDKTKLSEADLDYIAEAVSKRIIGKTIDIVNVSNEDNDVLLDTMNMFGI